MTHLCSRNAVAALRCRGHLINPTASRPHERSEFGEVSGFRGAFGFEAAGFGEVAVLERP